MPKMNLIPIERINQSIFILRDHRVLLDKDLAELYGVETRVLKQAVKRNITRFPDDFMFELTRDEADEILISRSQSVTLKRGGNIKYLPYAFTEQGVAMLSSVLNSTRAIQVNIAIMRAFVQLRQTLATNQALSVKLKELESKLGQHDQEIEAIINAINLLTESPKKKQKEVGYHTQFDN